MTLYDNLVQYAETDAYPFHMPGHKRRAEGMCDPIHIDITEIDGFDNLHHAEGILLHAQEKAAALYHSSETHFLVNGSTAGILSAIGACTRPGSTLLMARNSHRSAYNAAALNHVKTVYLYPQAYSGHMAETASTKPQSEQAGAGTADSTCTQAADCTHKIETSSCSSAAASDLNAQAGSCHTAAASDLNAQAGSCHTAAAVSEHKTISELCGSIDPAQIEYVLSQREDISAVFITSPTYDGVICDVKQIAQIVHRHNAVLIVDEAHGAHFGMHEIFPESSVMLGADLVIHSLHKTLPALTQTALIHVNGPRVDRQRLRRLLSVYQTSSPSYVLMASIDRCVNLLLEKGSTLFDAYAKRLERFYAETPLHNLSFLRTDDPSRIIIRPGESGMTATEQSAGSDLTAAAQSAGFNLLVAAQSVGSGMTAMDLYRTLIERFHLQPEMVTPSYVLMLSSVCDDDEGFSRLSAALRELDNALDEEAMKKQNVQTDHSPDDNRPCMLRMRCTFMIQRVAAFLRNSRNPEVRCTIARALDGTHTQMPLASSAGHVSAEFLTLYPPGIPLLVPGEIIPQELVENVTLLKQQGYSIQGFDDHSLKTILTVSDL